MACSTPAATLWALVSGLGFSKGDQRWTEGAPNQEGHTRSPACGGRPVPHTPGIRGQCPHGLKCWLYFPEDDCPFYRTTVFSHYAKKNCPADSTLLPTLCLADASAPADGAARPGPYWSLMFEISESNLKPVAQEPVTLGGTGGARRGAFMRQCVGSAAARFASGTTCAYPPRSHPPTHPLNRHLVRGGEGHAAGRHQHAAGAGGR